MGHPTPSTVCAKCGGKMEFGLLVDATYGQGGERAVEWVRGEPSKTWFSRVFKTGPEDRLQVATLRCTTCSYVELYAPQASE